MIVPVRVDLPKLRARAIAHDVVGSSYINYGIPVGCDLWVGDPFQVKYIHTVKSGERFIIGEHQRW